MKRTPIKKVNRKRKAKRYADAFGDKAEYVRQFSCCACGRPGPSDPHHYPSRAAGGTSKDLVPLCRRCHGYVHLVGSETFQREHGILFDAIAARYEEWYHMDPQPLAF